MRLQLLPSTFEENGTASKRQHLTSFVIDDSVAFDAGSLAMASSPLQKRQIRDVVLSHAHLDHIAGLPLFVDDLFATLERPVLIHGTAQVIETLDRDIFNWSIYPKFSELTNVNGSVLEYREFTPGTPFTVRHLSVNAIDVNHKVPSTGFIISDGSATIAMTGDTAAMDGFWESINEADNLDAILIECAFPDELAELAAVSHHLTPSGLQRELEKCDGSKKCSIYVVNLKPMYCEATAAQINKLGMANVQILEVGRIYEW